ncbi:DUS2 [Lepeophtheirus salmonis]|uniref:DUS2 n=1 Tax=Lepeophtheirus salmonis TaxID=72036 RepID=A0A7R8CCE1_LEPSM|nr:DUS2 [Lepeophtheirus salmonis]CAF2770224.1 DUS2 [Lepeophtheirus salmonis]
MVKIGTLPMRLLALNERVLNPMLDTVDYVDKSDSTLILRISPKERGHLVLQIGTSDPDRAVAVAMKVVKDVDGIDVNMGCPKPFSLKGGMGAALLSDPDKIKSILTHLVEAVGKQITVTCKIRILNDLEDTLNIVRFDPIYWSGCPSTNGGSSNNRDLVANTHEGILSFWKESTADSVMIARAAEWNVSVFSKNREDIYKIIDDYLDTAIHFDYPFNIVKYNVQQILGSDQDTEKGRKFLSTGTLLDLCNIFDKGDTFSKRQGELSKLKRKLSSCFPNNLLLPEWDSNEELTVMFAPYVRTHYPKPCDIPKAKLLSWFRLKTKSNSAVPSYNTIKTKDKVFQSIVRLGEFGSFASLASEKNIRYSEQAAAIVALHCLGIQKFNQ